MSDIALGDIAAVRFERQGPMVVAHLSGEIDMSNEQALERALRDAVPGDADGLVIDLGPADYIDSSGIRTLFVIHRHLKQRRQALRIAVPTESHLRDVLEISGVAETFGVHESVETAVAG